MLSLVQAAGWPVWFLLLSSVCALALTIERFVSLERSKVLPPGLLEEVIGLWRSRAMSAEKFAKLRAGSALGRILACGLKYESQGREFMKESMEEASHAVTQELERYLSALGTIASVAPLLGLFGTVVGMIEIFGTQGATAGADPHQLAHGISVALYNTALGIFVAILSTITYRHFQTRVQRYLVEMEQESIRLVEVLSGASPR